MKNAVGLDRRSVVASLLVGSASKVLAQADVLAYPTKAIRVLVGVPPGGSTDALTRLFAAWLQEDLGQTTIVENRPGANTAIAAGGVALAPPDGHTLLVASDAFITVSLLTKLPYDIFTSFAPISTLTVSPFVYVVHPSLPVHSIGELIAFAKANPGKVHYGSSGSGGASHLGAEKLKMLTGVDIVHVPYRGAGPALVDALSGQYQLSLWTSLAVAGHVKSGKLRALAVTGPKRLPSLPDTPTFAEAGLPDYDHHSWLGVYAPAGTPQTIIDRIDRSIAAMMDAPATRQKLTENGVEPLRSTPAQFTQLMRRDIEELVKLIKSANIKMD